MPEHAEHSCSGSSEIFCQTSTIFSHSEDGTLLRVLPNDCNAIGPVSHIINSGEELQIPQGDDGSPLVFGLDKSHGQEWFYVVSTANEASKIALADTIREIPDICQEIRHTVSVQDFQAALSRLESQSKGQLQWLSRSFYHDG